MAELVEKIARREDVNPKEGEKKYGNVEYADEKNKKYPIDTKEHVLAALRYIGMPKNRNKYSAGDLAVIEGKIHTAAKRFGIDEEKKSTDFTFFANVLKATETENGDLILEGEASGPELDQDGERMAKSAIESMMKSILEGLVREDGELTNIPLVDAHQTDGVGRELGEIISAELTDKNHLAIKATLDKDNPLAISLYKQLQKGKQYGLSVAGVVNEATKVWDENVGKYVKTFLDVALNEISVTSRPSWSDSYVNVLAKSAQTYFENNTMEKTQDNPLETTEAVVTPETEALVNETETTEENAVVETTEPETESATVETEKSEVVPETLEAEGEVEKGRKPARGDGSNVTMSHLSTLSKGLSHAQNHVREMMSGTVKPSDEMDHLAKHISDMNDMIEDVMRGRTDPFDDDSEIEQPAEARSLYLSHEEQPTEADVKKSEEAIPETTTETVKEPEIQQAQMEKSLELEALKSEIEAIKKAYLTQKEEYEKSVESLEGKLSYYMKQPVGSPKGYAKAVTTEIATPEIDKSRILGDVEAIQKEFRADEKNPNMPYRDFYQKWLSPASEYYELVKTFTK